MVLIFLIATLRSIFRVRNYLFCWECFYWPQVTIGEGFLFLPVSDWLNKSDTHLSVTEIPGEKIRVHLLRGKLVSSAAMLRMRLRDTLPWKLQQTSKASTVLHSGSLILYVLLKIQMIWPSLPMPAIPLCQSSHSLFSMAGWTSSLHRGKWLTEETLSFISSQLLFS